VVKDKPWTTTSAEIALHAGTSCTMVIKVPVGAVEVLIDDEEPQLVKNPAASTTPTIFASLYWGVRLKSLLQFMSVNGMRLR
jgi:hypothetical protein